MKRAIVAWAYRDAEWWQFWMPQSGPLGGVIFGLVLSAPAWMVLA